MEKTKLRNDIANNCNKYFVNIGPNLANKIPSNEKDFESFVKQTNNIMPTEELTDNELKIAFFSLKTNKSLGYDNISYDVLIKCYDLISKPLKQIFELSLSTGIFPNKLKIAKVTPVYKAEETHQILIQSV